MLGLLPALFLVPPTAHRLVRVVTVAVAVPAGTAAGACWGLADALRVLTYAAAGLIRRFRPQTAPARATAPERLLRRVALALMAAVWGACGLVRLLGD